MVQSLGCKKLVFKAHRLVYHSTLGSREVNTQRDQRNQRLGFWSMTPRVLVQDVHGSGGTRFRRCRFRTQVSGFRAHSSQPVSGLGFQGAGFRVRGQKISDDEQRVEG